jgi:hypothetical protein
MANELINLTDILSGKSYKVKVVDHYPKQGNYHIDILLNGATVPIQRTDAGVLYALKKYIPVNDSFYKSQRFGDLRTINQRPVNCSRSRTFANGLRFKAMY